MGCARLLRATPARSGRSCYPVRTMPLKSPRRKSRSPILHRLIPAAGPRRRAREEETERVREMQARLLPGAIPQIPGFRIDCAWRPSEMVSGDYVDVFPLSDGAMALCVADVSGKGLEAVQLATEVRDAVRQFAPSAGSPAELCTQVNRALSGTIGPARYITLFYAILEGDGRLRYENAGHCQPVLVRSNGAVEFPVSFSGVMGIFSHWLYQNQELQLHPGDCLLVVTDGVLEAENRRHEEFGYRRLIAEVEGVGRAAPSARSILDAVSRFCGGRFVDDASIIAVIKN